MRLMELDMTLAIIEKELRIRDPSIAMVRALLFIAKGTLEHEAYTADYLRTAVGGRPRSVERAIQAFENRALITKTPDPEDRRANLLVLTPRGVDLISTLFTDLAGAHYEPRAITECSSRAA